jgi:hypothetical protein
MTQLARTSECVISLTVLVMNLEKWMKSFFFRLLLKLFMAGIYPVHVELEQYSGDIANQYRSFTNKLTIFC